MTTLWKNLGGESRFPRKTGPCARFRLGKRVVTPDGANSGSPSRGELPTRNKAHPTVNPSPVIPDSLPTGEPSPDNVFAAELQSHQGPLKSWLRSRFPWLGEVDDIAQEAVFRLWRRQNREDAAPLRSPKAALFSIARNAVVDLARHRAVARTDSVAEMGELSVLDGGADVVETVAARQELEFLADALRELPTRCRQVITLAKIYGLSEREVAERLGISENTVRTHVVRGMERCTEYLRARGVSRTKG